MTDGTDAGCEVCPDETGVKVNIVGWNGEVCDTAEFLTGQQIAKLFKVSNSTVNLWKRQGMPFYGKSSCARFLKAEVVSWQKSQSKLPVTKGKRMKKESE